MPVEVVFGSGRVIFPELVRLQRLDGDFGGGPIPIGQLALGEPPAEGLPGVYVIKQPDLGLDLAGGHGAEKLAEIEAMGDAVELAALVPGLSSLTAKLPAVEDHGQSKGPHTFFGPFADSNR